MPTFTITSKRRLNSKGEFVEVPLYFIDGKPVSKRKFDATIKPPPVVRKLRTRRMANSTAKSCWPIKSDALAVHPVDVAAAEADAKRKGVPTEFLPDGRPVIRSSEHQKRYIKAYRFFNRKDYSG